MFYKTFHYPIYTTKTTPCSLKKKKKKKKIYLRKRATYKARVMRLICFNGLSYSDNYMSFCHFFSFTSNFLTYLNKVEQYLFLFLGKKGKGKICL